MYLAILYLISFIVWSLIAYELLTVIRLSVKKKTQRPRLLAPLFFVSLAIVVDSLYSLAARISRLTWGLDTYLVFTEEQYLFLVKVFIAISGIIILLGIKRDKG